MEERDVRCCHIDDTLVRPPRDSNATFAAREQHHASDGIRYRRSSLFVNVSHDDTSVVGLGATTTFEFEFALNLLLDGLELLRDRAS